MAKIVDACSGMDDRFLEEALRIDSAAALRAATGGSPSGRGGVLKRFAATAACFCLLAGAIAVTVTVTRRLSIPNDVDRAQVVSPVTEVSSRDEMTAYLGFTLPLLADREASSFLLYATGDDFAYATMGEIGYADGAKYRMSRGSGDISGMYGGRLEGAAELGDVTVYYYELSGTRYAIWNVKGFACCYYAAPSETDLRAAVSALTLQIKS